MWRLSSSRTKTVPVIDIKGTLADVSGKGPFSGKGITIDQLQKPIDEAFADKEAPAVILNINSPGGTAAQAEQIADYIRYKAEETGISVKAFVQSYGASGGYWIACAADEIFCPKTSLVGSIGVIGQQLDLSKFGEQHGIGIRSFTAGKNKAGPNPFADPTPEQLAKIEELQQDIHEDFIGWVKLRRGDKLNISDEELFTGEAWTGRRAVGLGLVDKNYSSLARMLKEELGDVSIHKIRIKPPGLMARLMGGNVADAGQAFGAAAVQGAFAEAGVRPDQHSSLDLRAA